MTAMSNASRVAAKGARKKECCEPRPSLNPDHSAFLPRLNRVRGQIDGIDRMIQENRYCVDILVQFRAVMAALRTIEVSIFEEHLKHCVASAILSKDKKLTDTKIHELSELLTRRTSL